jgi:hypothetical protein
MSLAGLQLLRSPVDDNQTPIVPSLSPVHSKIVESFSFAIAVEVIENMGWELENAGDDSILKFFRGFIAFG